MKAMLVSLLLLSSLGTARAQVSGAACVRYLALRWVNYYATIYRVPVDLVAAIIDVESAWDPHVTSSRGAAGIMQLMPATASRFGVRDPWRLDENIRGGVAYLAWLNRKFRGDLRLVTAAYYVGESPISLRGLAYSSPDVQRYTRHVALRYRARRALGGRTGLAQPSHNLR